MKFGILVSSEFAEYVDANLPVLVDELSRLGCRDENIVIKNVPTMHDLLIGTQLFAEFTDVDGVIILAPSNRVNGHLALMNGIVQLQIQWGMVVEIGGAECAANIVEMIELQNEMESNAVITKSRRNFS
jgi:6,7-dimethyl-8-ribityllumazine synthase